MGRLIYSLTTSLDGFVADNNGNFEWADPSDEILLFIDDILKNVGTFLFGRRMYEQLAVWDTIISDGKSEGINQFSNIWEAANKIVYSNSLTEASTKDTVIERSFNAERVHKMVTESDKDFNIGGPHLAAEAIKANIIDEYHQYIVPLILGNGNSWLPKGVKRNLVVKDLQKFKNGTVHIHYARE